MVIGILLALALASAAVNAGAQTLKEQIVGTWTVVSAVNEVDGKKVGDLYGLNPQGQFIFTLDGHFSIFIVRPGRPKFASNNRTAGTPEENKEAMAGFISEFGTYTIKSDGSVTLHIVACSFPNWDATNQERRVRITGDEMEVGVQTASTGSGSSVITLRRAK
jgi:hypothetical protein